MAQLNVQIGQPAPDFESVDDRGQPIRLKDFRGQHVVLYFYPKDNTPGCLLEARAFNASLEEFTKRNTVVLGVSTDDVSSHERFRDNCGLRFRLIADSKKTIARTYGALSGLAGLLGLAQRVTVLIDKDGIVRAVWDKVSPRHHPEEVLEKIDELKLAR
ncbi:MAG: peroxiredoxin [Acidobacteriota bacterium]|nr:peroxiredoxin [Blastocatellia bacterium]MDW8240837.1 peroxiredoxin [Acidobacteriota bacterium]